MNTVKQTLRFISIAGVIGCTAPWAGAFADDGAINEKALYDLAPKDAAFVRVINLTHSPLDLSLDKKMLTTSGYCQASDYVFVTQGDYAKTLAGVTWQGRLEPGSAYSLVVSVDEVRLLEDETLDSPRRGLLSVYNFSKKDSLSVKTSVGGQTVFAEIDAGASASRSVNPLRASLSVFEKDQKLTDADPVIFERGVVTSLLVCGNSDIVSSWSRF